jgi:hypothetical protein
MAVASTIDAQDLQKLQYETKMDNLFSSYQSLFLLLYAACLAEKQQMPMLLSLL